MGSNETGSNSRPLTADERTAVYEAAQKKLGEYLPASGYSSPTYSTPESVQRASYTSPGTATNTQFTAPGETRAAQFTAPGETRAAQFSDTGDAKTLSGGDYDRLEQSILRSRLAPIDQAWQRRREELNQEMADRGLYASGIGTQTENKIFARDFLPAYQQAGGEASTQRYGLQSGELGNLNQYNLSRASQANQFNLGNTSMLNEGDLARANAANTFNTTNTQMLNEGDLARANAANTFQQTDAARRDQFAQNAAQGANAFETSRFGAEEQAAQGRAAAANAFAADQAEKQYQSKWRPADYWQGAWNGTGGVVSSSSGGGWSI